MSLAPRHLITVRSLSRWILTCFGYVFLLYYFTVPQQSLGGGITPAFLGLMKDNDRDAPGDGEGGDLKSVGTVTFSCMIFLLALKVRRECCLAILCYPVVCNTYAIPLFITDFCRFSSKPSHLFTARGPFALAIKKRARDSSVDCHIPGSE